MHAEWGSEDSTRHHCKQIYQTQDISVNKFIKHKIDKWQHCKQIYQTQHWQMTTLQTKCTVPAYHTKTAVAAADNVAIERRHTDTETQGKRIVPIISVWWHVNVCVIQSFPRPVHYDTNSTSVASIRPSCYLCVKTKSIIFPPLSTDRYSLIRLGKSRHHGENMSKLRNGTKWNLNPACLNTRTIYHKQYKVYLFLKSNIYIYINQSQCVYYILKIEHLLWSSVGLQTNTV